MEQFFAISPISDRNAPNSDLCNFTLSFTFDMGWHYLCGIKFWNSLALAHKQDRRRGTDADHVLYFESRPGVIQKFDFKSVSQGRMNPNQYFI